MQNNYRIFTNDNCTGCNRCISACTVPEANVAKKEGERNKIHIDLDHCINCGKCLEVCPHNARDYLDDTDEFLRDLQKGEKMAALFAPAVRSNFPQYKRLLGCLRQLGCHTLYDTSFGADICTWAYIRYIQRENKTGMISQPCPAVVNYIEKHDPELIDALVPIQSPAVCSAVYMRKYAKIEDKIAFISPCIAKKDEFSDPNTAGMIQYNITFDKLKKALAALGYDYRESEVDEFDNDKHALGAIFPMPGGLKQNVQSFLPDTWIYQVEGQPEVRHFLDSYQTVLKEREEVPFLVDILNCGKGCNLGTGTGCMDDSLSADRTMFAAAKDACDKRDARMFRRKEAAERMNMLEDFDKRLKLEDFMRGYTNKYLQPVSISKEQLENAYRELGKNTEKKRHIDCCSCGFSCCEQMAQAIAKGINHAENCVEYHKDILSSQQHELRELMNQREAQTRELELSAEEIFKELSDNNEKRDETTRQVARISEEVSGMKEISTRLNEMMDELDDQIRHYIKMGSQVVDISYMSELLSLNASIQAARAGDAGQGFAVVAEEMKSLSQQSGESANAMLANNELVFPLLEEVRNISKGLKERAGVISESAEDILKAMDDLNEAEKRITGTAARLLQA